MKQWLVGLVALTATAVQAGAPVELFNGKDLSGWYKFLKGYGRDNDPQNVISVTNGVIRITGETWGALVTEKEYSDYRLDVEYRWTGKKWPSKAKAALDSGILFHSTGPDGGFAGIWLFSHELNVIYGATGDIWTVGSKKTRPDMFVTSTARRVTDGAKTTLVYDPKGEEVTLVGNNRLARCDIDPSWTDSPDAKAAVNENPIGEWNTATLICRGAAVECLFNGKLVNRATAVSPSRGKIQLQSEGCEIEYRRVTLTPLAAFISPAEKREGHTVASFYRGFRNAKAVRKAALAATALGVFEVEVNGARVGNDFLKPGFTGCGQCRHVYTYDVTDLLKREADAENCILAQVAPTWWCDQINTPAKPTPWQLGKEVAFRCELKLEYGDGSHETVRTGPDWLAAYSARTQTAGLYEGEVYDSRESIDYLKPAKVNTEFRGELRPATAKIALREDLALEPKAIYVTCGAEGATADAYGRAKVVRRYRDGDEIVLNPGEQLVVDFGQNCSAVPSFQFAGRPGTQLEIRHAEMLNESNGEKSRGNDGPAGTPYLASLRSAYAGIRYTFAGGGDTYRPSFTFFGYRYLGVTATAPVTFRRIRSIPVSSITKEAERGTITTGDRRINRLIENIRWGLRSNYISIPTDCPQRDERLGWTADTQVFMNSAAYLTDTYGFLRKYLADLRDGQYGDGLYTCFVPNVRHVFPHWASCGWTDAGVMMPYRLWKWYGRTEVIDECWDSMEKYMSFLRTHETPYRIDHADWLAYEHKDRTPGADNRGQDPKYKTVMNSYFHYWMADLMRQMAEATGRKARAAAYADEAAKLRKAFIDEYVGEDGCIKDYWKGQCSDLYMLKLGLCGNAAAVEATKKDLIENIRAHGNRLQTGFLGTAILMPTLTFEANAPDVAYDLLFQDQDPSWLYSVDQGATTVWERWNSYTKEKGFGPTSMNSFNHYAYGCVLEWLFSAAAGIRPDPQQPGWKHFILQPFADRRLGHLDAVYDSPAGRITSSWKYDADGKLHWSFSIPEGATATVIAPGGETKEYVGGVYEL